MYMSTDTSHNFLMSYKQSSQSYLMDNGNVPHTETVVHKILKLLRIDCLVYFNEATIEGICL